jgi:hypothetical protein
MNKWKKGGGVVEKRGEEETKSMPHAPVVRHRHFKSAIVTTRPFSNGRVVTIVQIGCEINKR